MKFRSRAVTVCAVAAATPSLLPGIAQAESKTPIDHVVVIYSENITFDHYFGTYPNPLNDETKSCREARNPPLSSPPRLIPLKRIISKTAEAEGQPEFHRSFSHRA
ncbi:alkaline phosphatase family protein [Corynebacterium sp. KPL2838]|uniref:alkaline phosphatase family protein n=1 Tax=Corynebacterium sp. KPL2838 TaxID=3158316 RepID=UPI0032ECECD2